MKPVRGFKQWVRKVEGLPEPKETPSVEFYYHGHIDVGCLWSVLEDPEENFSDLFPAFTWTQTPQGGSYWMSRHGGETPISEEDIKYLEYLVGWYEEREGDPFGESEQPPW